MVRGQGPLSFHLDTHVAMWIVSGERRRLRPVEKVLREGSLLLSPVAAIELQLLHEIGRFRPSVAQALDLLQSDYGVEEASGDLRDIGRRARTLDWARDPFDRLIVAHALESGSLLLTADETIRARCSEARWD